MWHPRAVEDTALTPKSGRSTRRTTSGRPRLRAAVANLETFVRQGGVLIGSEDTSIFANMVTG